MRIVKKYRWVIVFVSCWSVSVQGQVVLLDSIDKAGSKSRSSNTEEEFLPIHTTYSKPFEVGEIAIEGNKRTKPYIITRELPFQSGDSVNLTELVQGFE